jgi:hypothetical protein
MRALTVKRKFSYQILFSYERDVIDRIPLYRPVMVGGKIRVRQNPYLTDLLKDRYALYVDSLYPITITDKQGNKRDVYRIDVDEYAAKVRNWYRQRGYVDNVGNPYVWSAIHDYEDNSRNRDPDNDWFNYPGNKKGKSHHPITARGRQRERQQRREYRLRKKQRELE